MSHKYDGMETSVHNYIQLPSSLLRDDGVGSNRVRKEGEHEREEERQPRVSQRIGRSVEGQYRYGATLVLKLKHG